jgi:hypothetical protein
MPMAIFTRIIQHLVQHAAGVCHSVNKLISGLKLSCRWWLLLRKAALWQIKLCKYVLTLKYMLWFDGSVFFVLDRLNYVWVNYSINNSACVNCVCFKVLESAALLSLQAAVSCAYWNDVSFKAITWFSRNVSSKPLLFEKQWWGFLAVDGL